MEKNRRRQISWAITTKCFLACRHCLVEASPSGMSMDEGAAARVISHLPTDSNYSLELTGGDPFADFGLLTKILEMLGDRKEGRRLTIHTTGQWAVSEAATREKIRNVRELGADGLDFLCDDAIHRDAGLSSENYQRAISITREILGTDGAFVRRPDLSEGIIPIGRGAATEMKDYWGRTECEVKGARVDGSMQLLITHTGAAYVCLNGVAPPVGSMVDSSYEEIMEIVARDPWHTALMDSGPLGVALNAGLDADRWRTRVAEVGECRACIELTRVLSGTLEGERGA
jgi:hypothetical protein